MGERRRRADRHFKPETTQLRRGQEHPDSMAEARTISVYQTPSYVFDSCDHAAARSNLSDPGNICSRLTNPTLDVFEQRMTQLEGGVVALVTASEAATLSCTFQNLIQAGDHIVSSGRVYEGIYNYLAHTFPEYGAGTTFVDSSGLEAVEAAIQDNTKTVFMETLGGPNSDIADIEKITFTAYRHQIPLVIDNTFAMPYLVCPVEYGADIVVHSATKFIGGHGITVGGVIVDGKRFDWAISGKFSGLTEPNASYHGTHFTQGMGVAAFITQIRTILLRGTGATLSPLRGFLFLQGLETLSLRVEHHVESALKAVEYLKAHPRVEEVHHPSMSQDPIQQQSYKKYSPRGDGSIFTLEIRGGVEKVREFTNDLKLFSLLANMAGVKSLVIHPASATRSQMDEKELLEWGIRFRTIRLSTGAEHIDDILEDLEEAFRSVL